jgi:uncharacterized lipoprotein YmbA
MLPFLVIVMTLGLAGCASNQQLHSDSGSAWRDRFSQARRFD